MELIGHLVAGSAVGAFSAVFGVGGGLLMVPYLVLLHGEPQHLAEGTSLLVIIPTAIAGVVAHARRGFVVFDVAAWVGAGGVVGALVGALVAHGRDPGALQGAFGVFVILVGLRMAFGGLRRSGSSR